MRIFPRSGRSNRRQAILVLVACVALALPTAVVATGAMADGNGSLKHKRNQVHSKVNRAQGDLDSSSKALARATARLDAARKKLSAARKVLSGTRANLREARADDRKMRKRLVRAQHRQKRAEAAVVRGRQEVADQKADIGRLAASNYQHGDPDLLGLVALLNANGAGEVTTQLNTVRNMMSRQSATLSELEQAERRLQAREEKLTRARAQVARKRQVTRAAVLRKRALAHTAKKQADQVASLVTSRRGAADKARRIRAHDRAVLARLKRQEARIKREILARARHQTNRRVANTGGMLYRPVPGYITSPYGWREHPIYHYWGLHDGDDFHAPCGTPERAAGTGTVVKRYYSSVWGNRLYLDLGRINGHNFTVIYNHISRYAVGSGARVARGQVVAYAGTTGWSTGCHLHFTVLRDGNPVNPMNYM